ncbi:MAG: RNA methyltransferase [Bacillota bacterium]|nr:RNA methyltransferase [Bacillota bacterium]
MKTIKSKDNSTYKSAVKLTKKKYRDETGMYLLEGIKPLEDAIAMGIEVKTIFVSEGVSVPDNFPEELCMMLEKKLFANLSDTDTSQGVVAVVRKDLCSFEAFAEAASEGAGNVVILDRLQDPGNIGTIIRTAEAAGYKGIITISGTADVYSPKVVRAAAGSLFRMNVIGAVNAEDAAQMVSKMGKKLTVTCLENAENCFEADLTEDIALVIGNEGRGVSERLMELSDIRVSIPMAGSIESLNAAVAAGILMYQSQKKNYER